MQQESDIVIADASCLIIFDNIDKLNIHFQLFGKLITSSTVAVEIGKPLPSGYLSEMYWTYPVK